MSDDNATMIYTDTDLMLTNNDDGPLLIVLDNDDDDDEYENIDLIRNNAEEQIIFNDGISTNGHSEVEVNKLDESSSSNKLEKSTEIPQTAVIDTSSKQKKPPRQRQTKCKSKYKNTAPSKISKPLVDQTPSFLSYISFDNVTNILTVSRMGSIYYCVEDLYLKVFSTFCILENFISLLVKPEIVILKQVTLSEKIFIEQHNPKLKKINTYTRYRLLSINSSDYLIKLKQLLKTNKNQEYLDKIIEEMRRFKRASTPVRINSDDIGKNTLSPLSEKRLSRPNMAENRKRLKSVMKNQNSTEIVPMDVFTYRDNCDLPSDSCTISIIDSGIIAIEEQDNGKKFQPEPNSNYKLKKHSFDKSETNIVSSIRNILNFYTTSTNDSSTCDDSSSVVQLSSYDSKSLTCKQEQIEELSSQSSSLPSIRFDIKEDIMLQDQPSISKPIDSVNNDDSIMPTIVNVEENVNVNREQVISVEQFLSCPPDISISQQVSSVNTVSCEPPQSFTAIYDPYSHQSAHVNQASFRSSHDLYHQEPIAISPLHETSGDLPFLNYNSQLNLVPSLQKTSSYLDLDTSSIITISTAEKSNPCSSSTAEHASSCNLLHKQKTVKPVLLEKILSRSRVPTTTRKADRVISQQYTTPPSTECVSPEIMECSKLYSSTEHHSRHTESIEIYSAPLSTSCSCPSNSLITETASIINIPHSVQPVSLRNSSTLISPPNTPNDLILPNVFIPSINLTQAIAEHGHCDIDNIPKIVVRYRKTFTYQTVDTTGQLFPTWFNEPSYRCIQCFTCDQVFTPQQFMIHTDYEYLANEKILNISPIQLLDSEKLSEHKVDLWNQFCTNLAIYSSRRERTKHKKMNRSRGRINGFSIASK